MVAVVVYGYRSVVVYGSGGGIRQRWWDMAAVVVYEYNDEDGAASA